MNTSIDVTWSRSRQLLRKCPVCLNPGPHFSFLRIVQTGALVNDHTSWKCGQCNGLFAYPFEYPDYSEDFGIPSFLRCYCELGAGIEFMLRPLQDVFRIRKVASMLDVGCGVPFACDFARTEHAVDASGVDPSTYAMEGSSLLNVPVDFHLLGEGSKFDGQQFDLVFASEVIEHVIDPRAFALILAQHLTPEGILVLTTPNADFVTENINTIDLLSIAWPGIHHAIFSQSGLHDLLRGIGFPHVQVNVERDRLIAFASRRPDLYRKDPNATRAGYENYMRGAIVRASEISPSLQAGHLFRMFRDQVSMGRIEEASESFDVLRDLCEANFQCDLADTASLADDSVQLDCEAFFARWPFFATVIPFYLGMLCLHQPGRALEASRHFSCQVRATQGSRFPNPWLWAERSNLYQSAQFHHALSLLVAKEHEQAEQLFDEIINERLEELPETVKYGRRDVELVVRAFMQRGVCKLQTRRAAQALLDFAEASELAAKNSLLAPLKAELGRLMDLARNFPKA